MARTGGERLCRLVTRLAAVIRVDALWLSTTPFDLRAGTIDADLAAMEEELAQLSATPPKAKGQAKRQSLAATLPRTDIQHEPESTVCRKRLTRPHC